MVSTQETLKRLEKFKNKAGITRVADLTHLDDIGIPVYAAIRPDSKSLSVSQGKGASRDEAKCSAIMESLEVYYAEQCLPDVYMKSVSCLKEKRKSYVSYNNINPDVKIMDEIRHRINWSTCHSWISGKEILAPYAEFCMNTCLDEILLYGPCTTGLSGGNSFEESLLHSLLEVIERDESISTSNVINIQNDLYEKVIGRAELEIVYHENKFEIPCFEAFLKSINPFENQTLFSGKGCHLNVNIALNRAITEAVQSRVTLISGARDDIKLSDYYYKGHNFEEENESIKFEQIQDVSKSKINQNLEFIKEKCNKMGLDILVYEYINTDIVVLKSKIVNKQYISNE